ncbi:MAG: GH92 family glycosyl hydrolase [Candidatus Eiseniibacteriota bacterium]
MRILALALISILAWSRAAVALPPDPLRHVDPFIGTGGHGHTFPGATVPFGMVQLSPDTRLEGWDGCSGYHDSDTRVFGFSHTHLSGTGVSDYGDILLLPATGPIVWTSGWGKPDDQGYGSRFRKGAERASPGLYAVTLDDYRVGVELTTTERTGMHRYTFPATDSAFVLLDLQHRDQVIESHLRVVSDREVEGLRRSRGWARDQRVYFVARVSKPFSALIAVGDSAAPGLGEAEGTNLKAALRFRTTAGERVLVKVGLSAVSVDGARRNLEAENRRWDFDAVRRDAEERWRVALSRVVVEGGTPEQTTIFYTALYHALLQPNLYTDVDKRYRGRDGEVHAAQGWTQYTVFSLWDTFRAAHPLYTLLEPERTADFVRTLLAQFREGRLLPVWELAGNETMCMIGYHAASVITDAWMKGIRGFDPLAALAAMKASAMQDHLGLAAYRTFGAIPGERESESVSKTLEYAYDDWCIAQLAGSLGRTEERDTFLRRAQGWRHVFDPATGLMRPRLNGRFKTPFDPTEVDFHFTEANAWQYGFFVPHDVEGHIAALGGPQAYAAKLDSLFSAIPRTTGREQADITGLYGQYAHGNEPSHHIAYLYAFAGQPWKTQMRVRRLLDSMYTARRDGLVGNEDCGQMSAWYVLSALGFYPVTPGQDEYVIGTPIFPRATLHLPSGRSFTIAADLPAAHRPYIQSARLNGRPLERSVLRHWEILAGGTLDFRMGAEPNPAWGVGPGRQPRSRIEGTPVTAAPFVAAGDARFRGSTLVTLASAEPGARIRYTLDGSEPGESSAAYEGPIEIASTGTLRFRAYRPGAPPSPVQEATFRRIEGNRRVTSLTATHRAYTGDGPDGLIDGVRGGADFRLGTWLGFYGVDMEALVDLGEEKELRRLAAGFLQDQNSWIFMPRAVAFETSLDGERFEPAGEVANEVDERAEGAVIRDYGVTIAPRRARWVRVRATAPVMCPAWHPGAGNRSFIFADEIVVE